jgi:hypothetical protein
MGSIVGLILIVGGGWLLVDVIITTFKGVPKK